MNAAKQPVSGGVAAVTTALLRDPGALYAMLHRQGPVQWSAPGRTWLVVGHEAARSVLRDERFRMPGPAATDAEWGEDAVHGDFVRSLLLEAEGPHHERLRHALGPVFAPRAVRAREQRIAAVTDELLVGLRPNRTFDGVQTVTARLPVAVVGDLVGVPEPARAHVSTLCRTISTGGGLASGTPRPDAVRDAVGALEELTASVREWLDAPADLPPGSVLAIAAADAHLLTLTEIVANVFSLYLAGHDTSRNLLSGLLLRLVTEGDLLDDLRAGSVSAARVVDHVLLADAPLTFTARVALEDVEVAGERIRAGDRVRVMLGAANHEVLRADGAGGPPAGVSFGEGRHVCLGAHVARLEGTVLLDSAARHWRTVALSGEPRWTPHFLHRGLASLPLVVTWNS